MFPYVSVDTAPETSGMLRVKICGVQEASDALLAAEAGADFVGLVFVPERRRGVSEDAAKRIVSQLRRSHGATPRVVGLFADQELAEVNRVVRSCGLDMAQLCGDEGLEYCTRVDVPVIKVIHIPDATAAQNVVPALSKKIQTLRERGHLVTLDRRVDGLQGGTGESFNWDIAQELSTLGLEYLLAGGLNPENVSKAVRVARPWGVDVSSGVETGGVKDAEKIKAFVQAARGAGSQSNPARERV